MHDEIGEPGHPDAGEAAADQGADFIGPAGDDERAVPGKGAQGDGDDLGGGLAGNKGDGGFGKAGGAEKLGAGGAGADAEDMDFGAEQFTPEAEAPVEHKGFGGGIHAEEGHGLEGGGGGEVDDGAAALEEAREEVPGQMHGGAHVEVDHGKGAVEVGFGEGAVGAEAAIINEEDLPRPAGGIEPVRGGGSGGVLAGGGGQVGGEMGETAGGQIILRRSAREVEKKRARVYSGY